MVVCFLMYKDPIPGEGSVILMVIDMILGEIR